MIPGCFTWLCFALVAQAGDRTRWEWFLQNAEVAEQRAQAGMKKGALQLVNEMRQEAERQKRADRTAYVQMYQGVCEYHLGDLSQAIDTLKAIEASDANILFRHELYRNLGDAYLESGNTKRADEYLAKALAQNDVAKALKFPEGELVRIQLRQAQCTLGLGNIQAARERLAKLKPRIGAGAKTGQDPEIWACLQARWNMLQADLDLDARNPLRALMRMEESRKDLQRFPRYPEALDLRFRCHIALASDYWLLARFADAQAQLESAESVGRAKAIVSPRNRATLKNARAALLIERTTLAIEEDGPAEPLYAELDEAQRNLEQALAFLKKTGSGADYFSATIDFQLAQVHELRGRLLARNGQPKPAATEWNEAKQHIDKAVAWRESNLPAESDLVLEARARRAWLNLRLGNAKAAQQEGQDALKQFDKTHKKNDLDRGRYLQVLMEAEDRLGNVAAAARYAQAQRHVVDDGLGTMLAGLSASEQIQFFRKWDRVGLDAALRLGIEHAKDHPELAAASVEWLINGRTKLTEVLAAQVKTAKRGGPAEFARFEQSVQRQAYLLYGQSFTSTVSTQTEYLIEEAIKRELAEQAAQQFPMQPHWYALKEIRTNLRADEIFVGIHCLRLANASGRSYCAWVLPAQGPVRIVRLGDAATIDALMHVFLRAQERMPLIAPGQEKHAELELRAKCLGKLSRLILEPILAVAGGKTRWVVSPDGPLWSLPWGTLLLPDGERYAIEEMTFRYAVSGGDLVPDGAMLPKLGEPMIVGDPRFNYRATPLGTWRKSGDPLRIPWDRLPYSELECDTVWTIMERLRMKPERLLGVVRKKHLQEAPLPPRIVYLSTEAYAPLPSKMRVDDPLLSCALAFAGWNYVPDARRIKANERLPGMMTGAEVLGLDLRGTELVVLASCQAAGADAVSWGQSPANLRHAFHLAGARAVVSALWATNDRSTLGLMEPFMEAACRPSANKADALRGAQQQSIRYLRMYRDHSHPFFWAGFTLTGG